MLSSRKCGTVALALALVAGAMACRRQAPKEEEQTGGRGASYVMRAQMQPGNAPPGSAQQQPPPADAALACYALAHETLQLAQTNAVMLCTGAVSGAPVQCFQSGRNSTRLLDEQLATLCRCASSDGPVGCYVQGLNSTFLTDDQLVAFCNATATQQLRPNCAPWG